MSADNQPDPGPGLPTYVVWGARRFYPPNFFTWPTEACIGKPMDPRVADSRDIRIPPFFTSFYASKTARNQRYKNKFCVCTVPIRYRAFILGQHGTNFEPVVSFTAPLKEERSDYLGNPLEVYASALLNRDVYAALFGDGRQRDGESILFDIHLARERCALCGVRAVGTEHLRDILLCTECATSTAKFFRIPLSSLKKLGYTMFHTGIVQLMTLEMSALPRTRALWFEFVPGAIVSYLRIPGAELLAMINFREHKYQFPVSGDSEHYSFDACPVRVFYAFENGKGNDNDSSVRGTTTELEDLFSAMGEFQFVRDAAHRLGYQINRRSRTCLSEILSLRKLSLLKVLYGVEWGVEPHPPPEEEGFMNSIRSEEHLLVRFCWTSEHFRRYFNAFIEHLNDSRGTHTRMSFFKFETIEYEPDSL